MYLVCAAQRKRNLFGSGAKLDCVIVAQTAALSFSTDWFESRAARFHLYLW